eukprot:jgi/Orpsp1_1/1187614/evm.model.d7180000059049.1
MKFLTFASVIIATEAFASICHHDKYECCNGCKVIEMDDEGRWGAQNGKWCLIDEEKCSDYHEYPDCTGCDVFLSDKKGKWGAENNQWCIIDEIKCGLKESSEQPKQPEQSNIPVEIHNNSLPVISIVSSSGTTDFYDIPANKIAYIYISVTEYPPKPYYEECSITLTDADGTKIFENVKADVKVRGNFTSKFPKKPLLIKFEKSTNLLGMNNNQKYKNWVLLSGFKDYSMVRDKSMLDISRAILTPDGYYSTDTRYVELYLNGEYKGLYVLSEQQQVEPGRINVSKVKNNYEGTDICYFIEYDGYAFTEEPLYKFTPDMHNRDLLRVYDGNGGQLEVYPTTPEGFGGIKRGSTEEKYTIHNDIYSEAQRDFIKSYLDNVYNILYEAAYNNKTFVFNDDFTEIRETSDLTPQQAVEKVIDVQSLVDVYIVNEIACDADVAFSSFFMDVDFGIKDKSSIKLRFEAPWDFDSGLGFKEYCVNGQGFHAANVIEGYHSTVTNP